MLYQAVSSRFMSLKLTLAAERRKREAAEAEVARLRTQLEATVAGPAPAPTPPHLPGAAQDLANIVSQLKLTEQQLEDQQSLVRQVIDTSPNLVYVEDEQGRCILANKSYVQLLRQQDGPSRPVLLAPPGTPPTPGYPRAVRPVDTSISTSFEESFQLKDGSTVWYSTTKSPLVRSDGSRYLLTFSSDITDLKYATRVAEESVQAKQIFMANMSHEIRTPLHGVMGLAELLKKEPLSAEQGDYVDMIQYSLENLLVVINDILDFAKIESGKISLESIPFDILRTVQDAARSLTFKMDEKGLLLRIVAPDEPLPLALGDPYRLHQVLVNLIGNAIKFTQRGAITITIEARHSGRHLPVTFSVADTGIGISADNIGQVFNSFRQADSSIPRLYGGTGLGLTICKNLVELQDGQIGVRSEPDQGSCFYFTIPYAVSEAPLVRETPVMQQTDLLEGLNILLAEDNAVNQLIAVSMLGQWQVQVDMAQNGEEALFKAFQRPYDLILMDIQMPQLDGIETTARLRAVAGPNQNTPIVALTADAIRVNADSSRDLGFTDYLTKPYAESALFRMLAQVSQRAQAVLTTLEVPQVPAAPASRGLHYDFSMLGRLATDEGFIRKMLEMFVERVPGQVQGLHEAIEREDWPEVAHAAHSLKTIFGSLNIQPETSHLKKMEEMAENKASKADFQSLINAVVKGTELFCTLFSEELAQKLSQEIPY